MNIYPREVEEALLHHAGVRAVAVVGRPDPEWGETVVAFVVPPTVTRRRSTSSTGRAWTASPATSGRKDYRFVDALPTNNYGKVVKRELRDRL